MRPYYADDTVTLYRGDALAVLRELPGWEPARANRQCPASTRPAAPASVSTRRRSRSRSCDTSSAWSPSTAWYSTAEARRRARELFEQTRAKEQK